MTNLEKYNQVFIKTFDVEEKDLPDLAYKTVPLWDSVGHMTLMAALEDEFSIMIEPDDIIELNSYEKGKTILSSKYYLLF